MSAAEKFLLAFNVGRAAVGRWRLKHIFSLLATVTLLTLAVALLMCILMVGGLYATYHLLLNLGLGHEITLLMIVTLVLLSTYAATIALQHNIRRLSASMRSPVSETVDAFFDGLFSE